MNKEFKRFLLGLSHKSSLFSRIYLMASELKNKRNAKIPDEEYIKMVYKARTGRELNLVEPVGFNEKLQWLKLYNHDPRYTVMVDKVLVKDYVADILGTKYLIPTLRVWDSPSDVDFDELPSKFVLKCNHNSGGGMCICTDKVKLDVNHTMRELIRGYNSNSFIASREWPYKNVKKKILAEQYMEDGLYKSLLDYKFYCFNGEPKFLYVGWANFYDGRKSDELSYYNLDWTPAPFFRTDHKPFPFEIEQPRDFDKMICIAARLSQGIPFVRVDLYNINGEIYFSEFTFSPGGGFSEFQPYEWEKEIGSWIDLSRVNSIPYSESCHCVLGEAAIEE